MSGYRMRRVCSWCKRELEPKPVEAAAEHGKVTHTICPECNEKSLYELMHKRPARCQALMEDLPSDEPRAVAPYPEAVPKIGGPA